jgi:Flp pilus assembly protein TadD
MWQRCLVSGVLVVLAGCASGNPFARFSRAGADTPPPLFAQDGTAGESQTVRKPLLGKLRREDTALADTMTAAERAESQGNLTEAKGLYERALTYRPDHPRAHHRLATIADRESRFGDAERHYRAALKVSPKDADLLSDLGFSYQLQGRDEESEQRLRDALRVNPKHRQALFNLGNLYARHGRPDDALALYRKAGSEAEAVAALAQAEAAGNSLQRASHSADDSTGGVGGNSWTMASRPGATGAGAAKPLDAKTYPNAATRKLAEEIERQRADYDRREAARKGGRPGGAQGGTGQFAQSPTGDANNGPGGAMDPSGTPMSSEQVRARFGQIDQQYDPVPDNTQPMYVESRGGLGTRPTSPGYEGGMAGAGLGMNPGLDQGQSMSQGPGATHDLTGFGQPPQRGGPAPGGNAAANWPPRDSRMAGQSAGGTVAGPYEGADGTVIPTGGQFTPGAGPAALPPHIGPATTSYPVANSASNLGPHPGQLAGSQSGQGLPAWPYHAAGQPGVTSAGASSSHPGAQRAAQMGLGAGPGTLALEDATSRPAMSPPMGSMSADSTTEAEFRLIQSQMQQLQQRQMELQQRLPPRAVGGGGEPQIRPGQPRQ